jgi:DNA-binding NarL/FixJ family response regulator
MGEPVPVSVVAQDPMLEAGVTVAVHSCPDVAVSPPGVPPAVTVVIVDELGERELDLVRATRTAEHRPEVVLVTTDLTPTQALHAIATGARGLLRRRETDPGRLARTVLAAAAGDAALPPDLLDHLLEHTAADGSAAPDGGLGLSARERDVFRLVADGRETGEIARELSYSQRTVAGVVHDVTNRFRLRNRAHAVAYVLRAGLL